MPEASSTPSGEIVNANVQYELGIAHSTQQIYRQVLIAENGYKRVFDTKDLIFMEYQPKSLTNFVEKLTHRIESALSKWEVEEERFVQHAIAKITPFEFEIVMIWAHRDHFAVSTSGTGPDSYERSILPVFGKDERFMQGVFKRHCDAIAGLQRSGLIGLNTLADPPRVQFSYYWTDLGNQVLLKFKLIKDTERIQRYKKMPKHLRRVT